MTLAPDVTYELSEAAWGQLEDSAITLSELYRLLREPAMRVPTGNGSEVRVNGHGITAVLDDHRVLAVGIDGATAVNRAEWAVERAVFGDGADADDVVRAQVEPRSRRRLSDAELAERTRRRQLRELRALTERTLRGTRPEPAPALPAPALPAPALPAPRAATLLAPAIPAPVVIPAPATTPAPAATAIELLEPETSVLDLIHPALHRDITRWADGDLRRVVVHSPTNVTINPPIEVDDYSNG